MGVDTIAKLRGNVSEKQIADFLKTKFGYKTEIQTTTTRYPNHSEIKERYDNATDGKYTTISGFIHTHINDEHVRSIFYCKNSVNFHENLEYYKEKGLEDMVLAETTHISLGHNDEAVEIIGAIVEYFGGWFCESDCGGDYELVEQNTYQKPLNRIDIMVDIETLGKGDNPPVIQIAASTFNISTGDIIEDCNLFVDVRTLNNIEGDTLLWWLNTDKELLTQLLNAGTQDKTYDEAATMALFNLWITHMSIKYKVDPKNIYLWGNGILFDNRIIQKKFNFYGIEYPIFYRNDRDVRTIVELAAKKKGFENEMPYKDAIPKTGTTHNALADVHYQVALVCQCYKDIEIE